MQLNKAILRNSEISIFDKKKKFRGRPGEFFFPTRWIKNRFFFDIGSSMTEEINRKVLKTLSVHKPLFRER